MAKPPDGPIPFRVAQVCVQMHTEFGRKEVIDVIEYVGSVDQRVEKWESVLALCSSKASSSVTVALPWLWLHDDVIGPSGEAGKKVFESSVSVIQVNLMLQSMTMRLKTKIAWNFAHKQDEDYYILFRQNYNKE